MQILLYIAVTIALTVFLVYSILAVQHALKFRHISNRTKNLTWLYIGISTCLFIATIVFTFTVKF